MDNILFLCLMVIFVTTLQVATAKKTCACGLTKDGVNACACEQIVVRPPKVLKIPSSGPRIVCKKVPGVPKLEPSGDVCSCGLINVSPAAGKRVHCLHGDGHKEAHHTSVTDTSVLHTAGQQHYGSSWHGAFFSGEQKQSNQQLSSSHHGEYSSAFCGEERDHAPHPADSVSLSIAYGLARNAANIPREGGLLYGPKSIPKIAFERKTMSNVPEERLHSIDKQVVELRARPATGFTCDQAAVEREAEQALMEEHENANLEIQHHSHGAGSGSRLLNYFELGYVPVSSKVMKFKSGSTVENSETTASERHFSGYSSEESNTALHGGHYSQSHGLVQHVQILPEESDECTTEESDCSKCVSNDGDHHTHSQILLHKLGY